MYNIPNITISQLDEYYKALISHPSFISWRELHDRSFGFYTGAKTVRRGVIEKLKEQEIMPLSCNLIAQNVNSLCGIEIQNAYRIKVNVSNNTQEARDFEDAINQYMTDVQNETGFENAVRTAFRDAIIGGLGFVSVHYVNHKPEISYISPYNIVLDFRDASRTFDKQQMIFVWEDLHENEIKLRYGNGNYKRLEFNEPKGSEYGFYNSDTVRDTQALSESLKDIDIEFQNRVFTCYRIEVVRGWQCVVEAEQEGDKQAIIKTIDPNLALTLPNPEIAMVSVVIKTVICQGKILKQELEDPIIVDGQIPIVPMVYQRGYNLIPEGLVKQIEETQEGFNIALSRMNAYANTEKIFATITNVNDRNKFQQHPENAIKPNAVLALAPGDKIETVHPTEAIAQQRALLDAHILFMKRASGIEDETKGIQTNAVSGVAQQQRDINSMRTNAFVFDNFKNFKKRIGKMILQQLQYSYDTDIVVNLMDGDKRKNIVLNNIIEYMDGTTEIYNDITAQRFSISIEQAPDEYTTRVQKQAEFKSVLPFLTNPGALPLLQSKKFVEWLGISNPEELIQELTQILQGGGQNNEQNIKNASVNAPDIMR